ncbi:uncharacterized protein LOC130540872 [Pan paniscus]|uniref:uncharacterized protein LOC130540872 n=1 Tax=Pan paniscus TaxID=9597 RepID=UPI0006C95EA8|nr:uncharacterized protein LOC130540872 [Pan paniscus]
MEWSCDSICSKNNTDCYVPKNTKQSTDGFCLVITCMSEIMFKDSLLIELEGQDTLVIPVPRTEPGTKQVPEPVTNQRKIPNISSLCLGSRQWPFTSKTKRIRKK